MRKLPFITLSIALLVLAGCSENKEKLKGSREPFIVVGDALKPDESTPMQSTWAVYQQCIQIASFAAQQFG